MPITGSDKAPLFAQFGTMRFGATRFGYHSGHVFLSVGGVQMANAYSGAGRVLIDSLSITDILNEEPNRCAFTVMGLAPTVNDEILLTLGSIDGRRLFAGHLLDVQQIYVGQRPANIQYLVSAVDYTWQLGFKKVTAYYSEQSATLIARSLITTHGAANGFTAVNVEAGLPTVPGGITFTDEDLPNALTRLAARIGGYWYVDYWKDLHFFLTDTGVNPTDLTPTHPSLSDFVKGTDGSQPITRAYVEGRGSSVLAPVQAGDTIIPLRSTDMFTAQADVFLKASFQGSEGGAQHLTYTGVVAGGGGTLVGPGISPAGAPAATAQVGTGLTTGTYQYTYTYVSGVGESLPSPLASVAVGTVAAPASAPTWVLQAGTTGPDLGAHQYAVTFVTAAGETTPSPLSTVVTTDLAASWAPGAPTYSEVYIGGAMNDNNWFTYVVTSVGINSGETSYNGGHQVYLTNGNNRIRVYLNAGSPGGGASAYKLYRSAAGGAPPYKYVGTFAGAFFDDTLADASLGATVPATNTANYYRRRVTAFFAIGGPSVTGRKIYRTAAGGSQLKFVATVADNVSTSYEDTVSDASLGANAPTSNTAGGGVNQVGLTGIAIGPAGTTARKVYRTVANGSQLKLQSTIANNTATTATDTVADGSLGANVPTGDTSGFVQPEGQVVAGSSSILIAGAGAFLSGGGWAIIGNGDQLMRYTGITGNTLTGVPTSGVGSIAATVAYNSTITAAPMLTGIPASGTGSILRALTAGDEVYLVVQRDTLTAQATLAARLGGDGIREEWIQDRRLSIPEATARGDAFLASRPLDAASISYRCRDLNTVSGKTITVNLTAPTNVAGAFKIQTVQISNFRPYADQMPTFTVEASDVRFSFADLLRQRRSGG